MLRIVDVIGATVTGLIVPNSLSADLCLRCVANERRASGFRARLSLSRSRSSMVIWIVFTDVDIYRKPYTTFISSGWPSGARAISI
jgi:hypothetical protein